MALDKKKKYSWDDGSKVWFTSDTHFGHEAIMEFCDRPFDSIEEMNEELVNRWNSVVGKDDTVFHLGDFGFGSEAWGEILPKLNGKKYLILGNHDVRNIKDWHMNYFYEVEWQMLITVEGQSILLNHYPMLCYAGTYRPEGQQTWQLFGHVHTHENSNGKDDYRLAYLFDTQYDVGVDNNNFTPINFLQLKEIMEKKRAKA